MTRHVLEVDDLSATRSIDGARAERARPGGPDRSRGQGRGARLRAPVGVAPAMPRRWRSSSSAVTRSTIRGEEVGIDDGVRRGRREDARLLLRSDLRAGR